MLHAFLFVSRVFYPQKLSQKIEADSQQKLFIRFLLKDAAKNKPIRVHQAFIRLSSVSSMEKNTQEIIFVAEPDASHVYKFDMVIASYSIRVKSIIISDNINA